MNFEPRNICRRIVLFVYMLVIFCIYPIIVDNAYFNITITKTKFFQSATLTFIACIIIGVLADMLIHKLFFIEERLFFDDNARFYKKPSFWMEMFILANVLSWYMSDCSDAARTGAGARYMGLNMYLIMGAGFICLASMANVSKISVIMLAVTSAYTYVIGIIQHLELDVKYWATGKEATFEFMHYREKLSASQFDIYMSTFGNINIFASFIVITLSLFLAVFVFTNISYMKIVSGIIIVLGGCTLMIANSDSGYMGVVGALFLLFLLSYNKGRVRQFMVSLILLACGNLLVVILNKSVVAEYDNRGGVAEALDRIDISLVIIAMLVIAYILVGLAGLRFKERLDGLNKKIVSIAIVVASAISGLLVVVIGSARGMAAFTFDDKWGTYRGFVWSRGWELFCDAPLINKLFGYGNESFGIYMKEYYYSDMRDIVGKMYDNAHNELLQYLVTLGLLGVVTYLGLFITSFIYMLKYGEGNYLVYGFMASITGYFVQSIVNLNQPITTPLYFVMMALGVGYTTYLRKKDGDYDQISSK